MKVAAICQLWDSVGVVSYVGLYTGIEYSTCLKYRHQAKKVPNPARDRSEEAIAIHHNGNTQAETPYAISTSTHTIRRA